MTFDVRWTESAFNKLEKFDRGVQERIVAKMDEAAADPLVVAKRLSRVNLYSVRVGEYRIIVSLERQKMIVLIVEVGHRSGIYRKL
jgi:mRNA interferase RelE/StbE